jgi:hypothetical protein
VFGTDTTGAMGIEPATAANAKSDRSCAPAVHRYPHCPKRGLHLV